MFVFKNNFLFEFKCIQINFGYKFYFAVVFSYFCLIDILIYENHFYLFTMNKIGSKLIYICNIILIKYSTLFERAKHSGVKIMDKINGTIGSTLPMKKLLKLYLVPCVFELVICSFHSSKLFKVEI